MVNREHREGPGQGPFDSPTRNAGDPIGDDAYPGGSGMMPPTADMDDPIPETGLPGEPQDAYDQLESEEELGPVDEPRP